MGMYPDASVGSENRYMKFKIGDNRFRILEPVVIGFEYWETIAGLKKPKRVFAEVRDGRFVPEKPITTEHVLKEKDMPKLFNAFVVWNYQTQRVELLEITQKKIIRAIMAYDKSPDWGDPAKYDLNVIRSGTDFDNTTYEIQAIPPKPLAKEIQDIVDRSPINMDAWMAGDNPFNDISSNTTSSFEEDMEKEMLGDIMGSEDII